MLESDKNLCIIKNYYPMILNNTYKVFYLFIYLLLQKSNHLKQMTVSNEITGN